MGGRSVFARTGLTQHLGQAIGRRGNIPRTRGPVG